MTPTALKSARAALGMTQGGLAEALGVSRRTVEQWECGGRNIPEPLARVIRLVSADPELLRRYCAAASDLTKED